MKKSVFSVLTVSLLATLLAGCGASVDQSTFRNDAPPQGLSLSRYSARVVDSGGGPRAGVTVTLENRLSNETIRVSSAADGRFEAYVPPGSYDAFLDDEAQDSGLAVVGPIDLSADSVRDLALPTLTASGVIRGRLRLADGQPASNRGIVVLPATSYSGDPSVAAEVPDALQTVTDSEGNFSLDWPFLAQRLGQGRQQSLGLDIVILKAGAQLPSPDFFADGNDSDPATEDEYLVLSGGEIASFYNSIEEKVDLQLEDSRADLQLSTGTGTKNRLGAGEADVLADGTPVEILAQAAADFEPFRSIDILDRSAAAYTFGFGSKFISEARFKDGVIRPFDSDHPRTTKPLRDFLDNSGMISDSEWDEMKDRVFNGDGGVSLNYRLGRSVQYISRTTGEAVYNEPVRLPSVAFYNVRTAASFKCKTVDGASAELRVYGVSGSRDHSMTLGRLDLPQDRVDKKNIVEFEISLNRF